MEINNNLARLTARQQLQKKAQPRPQKLEATDNKKAQERKLKEACDGFEEIFVHKMFQVMRSSAPKDGVLNGGRGEEIFQDMLDENYAKLITKNGSLGLSRIIYEDAKKFL